MIIETTEMQAGSMTYQRLTSNNNYWGVGYEDDLHVTITNAGNALITTPIVEDGEIIGGWLNANTVTDGLANGFGADTFDELWQECKNRNLIFPEDLLANLASLGYT